MRCVICVPCSEIICLTLISFSCHPHVFYHTPEGSYALVLVEFVSTICGRYDVKLCMSEHGRQTSLDFDPVFNAHLIKRKFLLLLLATFVRSKWGNFLLAVCNGMLYMHVSLLIKEVSKQVIRVRKNLNCMYTAESEIAGRMVCKRNWLVNFFF